MLRRPCSVVLCTSSCQVTIVVQDEQLGLGHAVLCAGPHGSQFSGAPPPLLWGGSPLLLTDARVRLPFAAFGSRFLWDA